MKQNNMLAMILAGGRGTRLFDLTKNNAKPAVYFGGKYRIIDFPLSNCANSNIDIVGVLTQYESVSMFYLHVKKMELNLMFIKVLPMRSIRISTLSIALIQNTF